MKIVAIALLVLCALVGCDKKEVGQACSTDNDCVTKHCGEASGSGTTCYDPVVEQRKMEALTRAAEDAARESEIRRKNQHRQDTIMIAKEGRMLVYEGSVNGDGEADGPGKIGFLGEETKTVGVWKNGDLVTGVVHMWVKGKEIKIPITGDDAREAAQ